MVRNLPCSTCVTSVPIHWHFSLYCCPRLFMFYLTPNPRQAYLVITGSSEHSIKYRWNKKITAAAVAMLRIPVLTYFAYNFTTIKSHHQLVRVVRRSSWAIELLALYFKKILYRCMFLATLIKGHNTCQRIQRSTHLCFTPRDKCKPSKNELRD